MEGSDVTIENVGLNPRRIALVDVLRRMGARIEVKQSAVSDGAEPVGVITVRGGRLNGTEIGGDEIPNLIDELPIAAVAGAFAAGKTVIRDAAELRVKESDRIATMAGNLGRLGVKVVEKPDGMIVEGPARICGGEVESFGDHRIAMAMSVLALGAGESVRINDVDCVATSYPDFWKHMNKLAGGNVE
jgi:3-phosphoshikimate 1-carboxyvinyltransferase